MWISSDTGHGGIPYIDDSNRTRKLPIKLIRTNLNILKYSFSNSLLFYNLLLIGFFFTVLYNLLLIRIFSLKEQKVHLKLTCLYRAYTVFGDSYILDCI